MRWILPNGKSVYVNDSAYRIDYDAKSKSKQQFAIKQFLKEHCFNHILFEEYRLPSTLLKVDFLNVTKGFAIEHQGVGHDEFNKFFHNNSRGQYLKSITNDVKKREFLEKNGYIVIETYPTDLPLTKQFFKDNYDIVL